MGRVINVFLYGWVYFAGGIGAVPFPLHCCCATCVFNCDSDVTAFVGHGFRQCGRFGQVGLAGLI